MYVCIRHLPSVLLTLQDVAAADAGRLLGLTNTASIVGGIAGNLATGAVLQVGRDRPGLALPGLGHYQLVQVCLFS